LNAAGLFSSAKVSKLLQKLKAKQDFSEMDNMALAGILSAQIVYDRFVENFSKKCTFPIRLELCVDRRQGACFSNSGNDAC
jgi:hypothetical protein